MDLTHAEYLGRVNRVIDYIDAHLAEDLSLEVLARVACFSPYHFHRVFGLTVGEPLGAYVQRLRLEKAAGILMGARPVADVARCCGFASHAAFSRAFRNHFGMSPSAWRRGGALTWCRPDGADLRARLDALRKQDGLAPPRWLPDGTPCWTLEPEGLDPVQVTVRQRPATTLAYVRHIGPYAGLAGVFAGLWARLERWARARDLLGPDDHWLAVYHDDPSLTEAGRLRLEVCLPVPAGTRGSDTVGITTLPAGAWAEGRFRLGVTDYPRAWYTLVGVWLPHSGMVPGNRPAFERYPVTGAEGPDGRCEVDICFPVAPAD